MYFLSHLRDLCTNFLFPKNRKVLKLETLSADVLLDTLPQAGRLENSHSIAIFDYNHPVVKELIWELKYSGNVQIAEKFGEILYDVIRHELADNLLFGPTNRRRKLMLIPIPVSDKRRFKRGWNQSELLAKQVMKRDQGKVFRYLPRQLAKLHHTESQTKTASRNERLKNLTNSMKILNPLSVTGECVVVIDDVTTTGATFAEARRALHVAGTKKIICIALAH